MKVVFDNLANFLSISPNQTPVFAVCLPGPSWTFLPFLFLLILYSLPYMYTLYNVHVLTPTCTVQYVISCAVNIRLQLYTCFLTMRSKHAFSEILNDIGRKKIAKFLMRTFTCRSTFLYDRSIILQCIPYHNTWLNARSRHSLVLNALLALLLGSAPIMLLCYHILSQQYCFLYYFHEMLLQSIFISSLNPGEYNGLFHMVDWLPTLLKRYLPRKHYQESSIIYAHSKIALTP